MVDTILRIATILFLAVGLLDITSASNTARLLNQTPPSAVVRALVGIGFILAALVPLLILMMEG